VKATTGCGRVATRRDEHIDDLAELIDGPVHGAPAAGDRQVGLVDLPAVADGVPAWSGSHGKQRRERLDPAEDGDMVDLDAAATSSSSTSR
jgi:hypothetical protein